jgi:hypothetical protein
VRDVQVLCPMNRWRSVQRRWGHGGWPNCWRRRRRTTRPWRGRGSGDYFLRGEAGGDLPAGDTGFNLAEGALAPDGFKANASGHAATAGGGVLLYATTSGRLYWGADAAGGAARVELAVIVGVTTVRVADVWVVA